VAVGKIDLNPKKTEPAPAPASSDNAVPAQPVAEKPAETPAPVAAPKAEEKSRTGTGNA
jgi:hypothetical protein